MKVSIRQASCKGALTVPGDKSISHRAAMIGSISEGLTRISNFAASADCSSTLSCMQKLGVRVERKGSDVTVHGVGLNGLSQPGENLYCGNSGTTMRLLCGLLSGQKFYSTLTGDESLSSRPMLRVVNPLREMGASITGLENGKYAPLKISGTKLSSIQYKLPVASAQVKTCMILAGLYSDGEQAVIEPVKSRDHTERMLTFFGKPVIRNQDRLTVGKGTLKGKELTVPGDISSAAFFFVLAALASENEFLLQNVGINPTRTGILTYLDMAGVQYEMKNRRDECGEPVADILVSKSDPGPVEISGDLIPLLVDEVPVIAVMAACSKGTTVVKDAEELRVKETDRIAAICGELRKMGVEIAEVDDGFRVTGPSKLKGAEVESHGDHRIAMSLAIAGLMAEGETVINGAECVDISFPEFFDCLKEVCGEDSISIQE